MKPSSEERDVIFKLLEENSTLGDVALYLKKRGAHHSAGSWDQLFDNRLTPALDSGKLSRDDLIHLLRLSEEHGKQHVFLYQCSKSRAGSLIDRARVEELLGQMNLSSVTSKPRILYQPRQPTITDVRWDGDALIVKVVKQRKRHELVGEGPDGDYFVKRYREIRERAVNVFKLSTSGILELRIYSHQNSSDYRADVSEMWKIAGEIFPRADFNEYSISNAKTSLWEKRTNLRDIVKFSDSKMRNSHGITLAAATGTEQMNLYVDEGATKSIEEFLKYDAYCDSHDVWWIKHEGGESANNGLPSKEIHMILTRAVNEFVLTSKCSEQDYDYVFDQLKTLNE